MTDLENYPLLTSNRNFESDLEVEFSLHLLNTESQKHQTEGEGFQRFNETETQVKELVQESQIPDPSPEDKEVPHIPLPPGKKYHLFVSYCSEDKEEARNITEQLTERFNLTCMNCNDDFTPGKSIDQNIHYEMECSLKVLLLLSTSYLKRHWCVTEAREVCQLSFTDVNNLNVIPVLLNPVQELPPFLKSIVYIDKVIEKDVAAKIYDAFNRTGTLDPLHLNRKVSRHNGGLICQKVAEKAKFAIHGLAFRFSPLEKYEQRKATQFDINLKQLENHYTTLTKSLNNKFLFRNYQVLTTVEWRCMALFLLFLAAFAVQGCLIVFSVTFSYEKEKYNMFNLIILTVGSSMVISIFPIGYFIIYVCRRVLSKGVHSVVLKHNLMFYKESKCLVYFDNACLSKPTLYLYRYDTTECEKHLIYLLKSKKPSGDLEKIENKVKDLIEEKLGEFQKTNAMKNWTSLAESGSNRHPTRNNRACLCEMIEDFVNKVLDDRTVIEV
ncbi:uncharacterized protein LOC133187629 [Saccostrea echinata]|uniref:uncharacterized protein LOC133187629 n=1 Tax=Saccostrea echinata TaxID=191078 RepID=UPI002A81FA70|nr:uncharacterized protein LOC133187629 [Saccostrea echinata]